ncbi:endonuclease/exonuclease/phosphatase family protein [Kitasatospora sp. MAP5-34]|uniref:endonuclease/exonuclease/phosphatase family protein n=1 Tax=Kitasatospora sp. MAP5-34 TaxID=3035102 RepID=UPI0024755DD4|nr:endonuclease/exonuclease/phosphatase family protein [Kitasatospora sp. MAP5-34]MDH6576946.1 cytolethal distending toxin subunit B [Kitasatospora sp. MAP5-34]
MNITVFRGKVASLPRSDAFRTLAKVLAPLIALAALIGLVIGLPAPVAQAAEPNQHTIVTYNSQGAKWDNIRRIVPDNDIIAIQEAGPAPDRGYGMTLLGVVPEGNYSIRAYRWDTGPVVNDHPPFVYWMSQDGGCDGRVNLAMVTHEPVQNFFVAEPGPRGGRRAAVGLEFGNTIYFNVHAGACGTYNNALDLLANIRRVAQIQNRHWAAVGDFNRDPDSGVTAWAGANGAFVYRTGRATQQSGGELDYMVSSLDMADYHAEIHGGMGSDHYPVFFREHPEANANAIDLVSGKDPGKFIGFENRSNANGTHVVTDTYGPTGSWMLRKAADGRRGTYYLINNTTHKCIDVYGEPNPTSMDPLDEWDCLGQSSAIFQISSWPQEPGSWMIRQMNTGLCVDTMGDQPKYLALYKCGYAANQHFFPQFSGRY